jgi:hypothetical protein
MMYIIDNYAACMVYRIRNDDQEVDMPLSGRKWIGRSREIFSLPHDAAGWIRQRASANDSGFSDVVRAAIDAERRREAAQAALHVLEGHPESDADLWADTGLACEHVRDDFDGEADA